MRNTRITKLCLTFIVALAAAVMAPTALAQNTDDPSSKQYNPPIPEQTGAAVGTAAGDEDDGGDEAGTGLNATIGSLPFTGMDLLIVGGVAFLLTGTGFALRRLSMPKGPST
ncbi:MAG: hypothetical protein ACXWZW_02110 [Solirubrobacterales bacterium]